VTWSVWRRAATGHEAVTVTTSHAPQTITSISQHLEHLGAGLRFVTFTLTAKATKAQGDGRLIKDEEAREQASSSDKVTDPSEEAR
jgi:hypothetical protein